MHRNLFGHAREPALRRLGQPHRRARISSDFSYDLATTFRRPGVFTPDTDMTLKLSAERETVDTYESTTFAAKAGLEHRFSRDADRQHRGQRRMGRHRRRLRQQPAI